MTTRSLAARSARAFGSLVRRRRGLAGLVAGAAVGAALTLAIGAVVPGLLRDDQRLESGRIVILSGTDDGYGGQRAELIRQWNTLGGDDWPKAEIIPVAGGADAIRAEEVSHARSGGADVDIYNLDVTLMSEFIESGYLRPLERDGVDLGGFLKKPLATCERGDTLWALPFNTDAGLLYYRNDLVGEKPDVSSWEAIDAAAKRALEAPPGPAGARLQAGYAGQLYDYEGLSVNAFEAIWAAGGEVVRDGKVVITESTGLQRLAKGLHSGNHPLVLPASQKFKETETTDAFGDGQVIFMRNWPVAYRNMLGGDSRQPRVPFKVAPLPGGSALGGQNLAIAAGSKHPRAAQALIEFLTNARSQQILFERGGFAATREVVYRDVEVQRQYPYAETLLDAVEHAHPRPETKYYALFSEAFRREVNYALDHGGDLREGADKRLADALRGVVQQ